MDNATIWENCLSYLSQKIRTQSFHTWLRPTKGIASDDGTVKVAVPNRFVAEWLEEHYWDLINEALTKTCLGEKQVILCPPKNERGESAPPVIMRRIEKKVEKNGNGTKNLNPRYTFESFVVGESNRFAHAAALAVAEAPGKTKFNPFYIYGGVGLGKTHLVQAIGHYVKDMYPESKVLYVSSEKFTNDFINSIGTTNTQEFVNMYRNVDLLLLDDIQFFAGKESTQVQFFHTFNTLYQNGKQIVLTSDRAPREIQGVEERLLSRYTWGLVTDIQPPDLETRLAILNKRIESDGVTIADEVKIFIAENITSNIRELEGSLIRIVAYSSLTTKKITLELAQEVLKDSIRNGTKAISLEEIIAKVSDSFKISHELLCSKKKTQEIVLARQVAMYLARKLTDVSLKSIGARLGGRDHSTVIHSCCQVEESLKNDSALKLKVDELVNSLYV